MNNFDLEYEVERERLEGESLLLILFCWLVEISRSNNNCYDGYQVFIWGSTLEKVNFKIVLLSSCLSLGCFLFRVSDVMLWWYELLTRNLVYRVNWEVGVSRAKPTILYMKDTCFPYLSRSSSNFGPKRTFDNAFGYDIPNNFLHLTCH